MQEPEHENESGNLEAPSGLVTALRRLPREPVFVPPAVDEAILRAARKRLCPDRGTRWNFRVMIRWAAGTVVVVLAAGALWWHRSGENSGTAAALPEDVNHDGVVDILDAFALARRVGPGIPQEPEYDFNRDGRVDGLDAETIAKLAVQLEKGGRS